MNYITELPEELVKSLEIDDHFDFQLIKSLGDFKHESVVYWGQHQFSNFAEALCLFLYNIEKQGIVLLGGEDIEFKVCYYHYFRYLLK